jgi:hypothetical protein
MMGTPEHYLKAIIDVRSHREARLLRSSLISLENPRTLSVGQNRQASSVRDKSSAEDRRRLMAFGAP